MKVHSTTYGNAEVTHGVQEMCECVLDHEGHKAKHDINIDNKLLFQRVFQISLPAGKPATRLDKVANQ